MESKYRMRKSVQYHVRDGHPLLILSFPMKMIILNRFWKPAFDFLSSGEFIPFEQIAAIFPDINPEQIESFLNHLVRKGFLAQEGFPFLSDYPFVSVIIPVRNRPEEITACIQSLLRLDYPPDKMEIIVVDDASEDDTPEAVSKFTSDKTVDVPVTLIALTEHKQASFCRNLAAQRAKGEILAFIDSDCLADPLWLRALVPAFKDAELGAVGGMVDAYFEDNGLDRYEKVKSSLKIGNWFKRSVEGEHFFYVPACNFIVKREPFLKLGGFKESLHVGEDVDFCWRLQDDGFYIEYRPIGTIYHKHRNNLKPFAARRFDYGTSEPLLQKLHEKRVKQLLLPPAESLFWAAIILSVALKCFLLSSLSGIIILADSLARFAKVRRGKIPMRFLPLFLAVFRNYLAFLYHCCAFVSRYYLIGAVFVFPFAPLISGIILTMHLAAGIVEYFVKKPRLNPVSFLFYFSLEQIAYQSGVWWGCLRSLSFESVNPKIVSKVDLNA